MAEQAYADRDYEAAYHAYERLFRENMADVTVSFYLGRSAYETQRYDEAVAAFERVLIAQPTNLRARLELGRSYFALQMYPQARAQFERALQSPLPPRVRANIERYLAHIDQQTRRHFVSGSVMAGVQYDTNVRNSSDGTFEGVYEGIFPYKQTTQEESSASYLLGAGLNHRYTSASGGALRWQSGAQLHLQSYTDVDDVDVRFLSLRSGPQWRLNGWSLSTPLQLDYLHYGGESYMLTPGLSVRAEKMIAAGQMAGITYRYQKRQNEISENSDRDATQHHLSAHYQQTVAEGSGAINLSGGISRTRKEGGNLRDVSTDTLFVRGGYFMRLSPTLNGNIALSLRQSRYPDKPPKVSDDLRFHERTDTTMGVGATLTWALEEQLYLQGALNMTHNDSNDDYYDYDKQVIGINLLYTF